MQSQPTIIVADQETLRQVREYASLKFTITEIATMLFLDAEQLRRQINAPGALHDAYEAGKLESQIKYRQKVKEKAEAGDSWAIALLEHWAAQQLEEELGGYA